MSSPFVPAVAAKTQQLSLQQPVFISDLHLNTAQPATYAAFKRFMQEIAPQHAELVILGDLFEYWAGDDDSDALGLDVASLLKQLSKAGTKVFLMQGNRDLLLGEMFAQAAGATLLADPCIATLNGQSVLLAHGDAWCTLDTDYMRFRAQTRNPAFQQMFLAKPLAERKAFIGQARAASEAGKSSKSMQIMDVTPSEIERALREAQVHTLIHGHTHRPATHSLIIDGQTAARWVLPDWDLDATPGRGGYLSVSGGQWRVLPIT